MADISHQGAMAMVKIDGTKVKQLREQKGLTQLYVATVVEVTTDTISRWENKHYPTIKQENAIRLAGALEIPLEDILETDDTEIDEQAAPDNARQQVQPTDQSLKRIWPLLILSLTIAALIAAIGWFFLQQDPALEIGATRTLPTRCTVGQPFPVAVEVVVPKDNPIALIVTENIPDNFTILTTQPELAPSGQKHGMLKWLHKVKSRMLFTFIVTMDTAQSQPVTFSGSVAASNNADSPVVTGGNANIQSGLFHWADSDGDYVISDQEILTVYDQYGDLENLGIDVDMIEEIWLGSGYRWNATTGSYEILP